jgi:lipopolysaccharide transport system ATP-binding protein
MRKSEIDRKFDEIVDFSGVEKFIDIPVKRYSSGMYVRLAFAVAAHLEPEILLVDEVLAVGDAEFQRKCLGKMGDVAREGRTVLFVSHNMPMITSLCPRCLLLESGRIVREGRTSDVVISYYTFSMSSPSYFVYNANEKKPGDEYVRLLSSAVLNQQNKAATEFDISESLKIKMHFHVLKKDKLKLVPNFHFHSGDGSYAFASGARGAEVLEPGEYMTECTIPGNLLNNDTYFVGLAISSFERGVKVHFYERSVLSFVVKDNLEDREGYGGRIPGVVRPLLEWKTKLIS